MRVRGDRLLVHRGRHAEEIRRATTVIGRLLTLEKQGEYFRQYFFMGDRDEMPSIAPCAWGTA
jgi:hypothetical protein